MAVSSWGINSPSSALVCRNQAGSDIFTDAPQIQPATLSIAWKCVYEHH
jgi:hypothetical protein